MGNQNFRKNFCAAIFSMQATIVIRLIVGYMVLVLTKNLRKVYLLLRSSLVLA